MTLAIAATGAVAVVPATGSSAVSAGVQPHRCGALTTAGGAQVRNIVATRVGCTTGRAVARRANGKRTYRARGFTCRTLGAAYACVRKTPQASIAFAFQQPS